MSELVVPVSRLKMIGQFLGAVVFTGLGWYMMITPGQRHGLYAQFIGLVTVGFFGAVAVAVLYRLLNPAPAIIINADGITDNSSGVSVGLIRWEQVGEIKEYRVENQVFLGIMPKDLDELLATLPRWKKRIIRANVDMGSAPVNIPQAAVGMKISKLVHEIEMRRPQRLS